jgi:hypothetical protein
MGEQRICECKFATSPLRAPSGNAKSLRDFAKGKIV